MYFSEAFNIENAEQYDWFDPILELDTRLFVDPFLVFKDAEWSSVHDGVIDYFQRAYELLAQSGSDPRHMYYRRVVQLMKFPEPKELRLGYTRRSVRGSGAGSGLAAQVVEGMSRAIERGLQNRRHFEELGILVERFNRDRISDVLCNLIKPSLIEYTQRICRELDIPMRPANVSSAEFDDMRQRWVKKPVALPIDPSDNTPIILVPKRFLRELPTLEVTEWYYSLDPTLREDLNLHLAQNLRKSDILAAARQNVDLYHAWVAERESATASPYDIDIDPALYWRWQKIANEAAAALGIRKREISTEAEMLAFAHETIQYVRHWTENESGWRVYWREPPTRAVLEPNMQIMFLGMAKIYCIANGVRLDREVETGRGPVDFTFSGDRMLRILLEMKKLTHGEFWQGLETQTPLYLKSQKLTHAIFLVIRDSTTKAMRERWQSLPARARALSAKEKLTIEVSGIDIMPRRSASDAQHSDDNAEYGLDDTSGEEVDLDES